MGFNCYWIQHEPIKHMIEQSNKSNAVEVNSMVPVWKTFTADATTRDYLPNFLFAYKTERSLTSSTKNIIIISSLSKSVKLQQTDSKETLYNKHHVQPYLIIWNRMQYFIVVLFSKKKKASNLFQT